MLFHLLAQGGSKGEFSKFGLEDADKFTDDELGGTHWDDRGIARMHRELEGYTSKLEVVSSRHDKAKVAMATANTSRRDGMCIGIDFLGEEFER